MAARLARLAIRFPGATAGLLILATVLAAAGTLRLSSVSYLEGHLPAADPELLRFHELEREFGSQRVALFAIGCGPEQPCRDVLEPGVLHLIRELTETARAQKGVVEVSSLTTAGILVGDAGGLDVVRVDPDGDAASLDRFRRLLADDPILPGTVVSRDLRTAAFLVRFDPRMRDAARNASVLSVLSALRARAAGAGFALHSTGEAVLGAVTDQYVRGDLRALTPVMIGLIVLLLVWIFRGLAVSLLALATVAIPAVWAFGLMGWAGRPLTPVVSTLPVLILVVGVTDAIHFLVRIHDRRSAEADFRELVLGVAREVGPPTTVTAFTASLGFLSFLAGPMPALRDFGVFASVGILGAWLATFTLVPIALVRLRPQLPELTPPAFVLGDRILTWVHALAHRRARLVVAVAVLAAGAAGVGISRVVAETDGFKLIGEGDPLAVAESFVRERLGGAGLELVYEVGRPGGVLEPAALGRLAEVERLVDLRPEFEAKASLLPLLRVLDREVAGTELVLPRTRKAAAQLLLLAEGADSAGVRRVVTADRAATRVSIGLRSRLGDMAEFRATLREFRQSLRALFDDGGRWFLTGPVLLSLHQADLVLQSQIASFSTAFLTIFIVLLLFVRSIPLGALGMAPNVLPVAAILGLMGFVAINLDVGTAMIASIVLGVSVDDTVYFLLHYQRARRGGASVRDATAYTFAVAGKPAMFSAVMLSLGFFVLAFSSFQSLALFGLLSGLTVLVAVATELALMPALLEVTAGRVEERRGGPRPGQAPTQRLDTMRERRSIE